jgi:hypothetical protein
MIDDDRKLLTEFLGECWQTAENSWGQDFPCHNRQFDDNWQDFGALVDRLKELGLWEEYHAFTRRTWFDGNYGSNTQCDECCYAEWLLDSVRCQKIAEFLRRRK